MTRVLVSTVIRNSPLDQPSGRYFEIDLEKKNVIGKSPIIETEHRLYDVNPRGGTRGGKGFALGHERIYLSNYSTVFQFDHQWNLHKKITHPSCACIHDIYFRDNSLWVASACNDMIFVFTENGTLERYYSLRDIASQITELNWNPDKLLTNEDVLTGNVDFRNPKNYGTVLYDGAHVNSLLPINDEELLVSLGHIIDRSHENMLRIKAQLKKAGIWKWILTGNAAIKKVFKKESEINTDLLIQPARGRSAVIRVAKTGGDSVLFHKTKMTVPGHSLLQISEGTVLFMNTTTGQVVHLDKIAGTHQMSEPLTTGFLRGAARISAGFAVLGSSQELIFYDIHNRSVSDRYAFSQDPNESVYDIVVLPPQIENLPENLNEHINR